MNEFSILTFNIWFEIYAEKERTCALLACIYKYDPDIICFQEVRPYIHKKLINSLKKYNYHYPEEITHGYGCVIFSKYNILKCLTIPFKRSSMGRELIIAKIELPLKVIKGKKLVTEKTGVIVGTSHFESEFNKTEKNKIKWCQIDETYKILETMNIRHNNVIFCCDSNITEGEENNKECIFPFNEENGWTDVWIKKGTEENRYTYDSTNNLYLKSRTNKYRSRLDRILYKCSNCKIEKINLVKDASNPVISWIPPSDHFGIYGKFELKKEE
jgi:exonuclease III